VTLEELGWGPFFQKEAESLLADGAVPARVAIPRRTHYILYSEHGEMRGEVTGKLYHMAHGPQDLPAVGDWVITRARPEEQAATIVEVLPRRTAFLRRAAGKREDEQVVVANVDVVFIVTGLDGNFNLRRLERYLVEGRESGARPVIVLNKADICENIEECQSAVEEIAQGAPVIVMSALLDEGMDQLRRQLTRGVTGALLGSSGVGKSTIINQLLGEDRFETEEVREADSRGRHTTTHRELVLLSGGGMLIDTPGMRELQLWGGEAGITEAFEDIEELAAGCKFRNCTHTHEPGCEVRRAIEGGELDEGRYRNYLKLQREIAYHNRKADPAAQQQEKERQKKLTSAVKRFYKKR
jgi:ribosome biogenesis GTPase